MKTHVLKTDPLPFSAVWSGNKTHEIRFDDRGFEVGDTLRICETTHTGAELRNGAPLIYTGREVHAHIAHIQSGYGLHDQWVILSLKGLINRDTLNDLPQLTRAELNDALVHIGEIVRDLPLDSSTEPPTTIFMCLACGAPTLYLNWLPWRKEHFCTTMCKRTHDLKLTSRG